MKPENLQYLLDNTPQFAALELLRPEGPSGRPSSKSISGHYPAKTIVYQDAVNYVNPQWMDIGKDMVAMFTGAHDA